MSKLKLLVEPLKNIWLMFKVKEEEALSWKNK